jgi:hypothetical protein
VYGAQDLAFQGELADLALGLPQSPVIRPGRTGLQPLGTGNEELIPSGGQPMGLHSDLAVDLVQRLAAQQPRTTSAFRPADQRSSLKCSASATDDL